jgi:cation:H+ antiporter
VELLAGMTLVWILVQFTACTGLVLLSGIRLSRYGDIIAEKTGIGGTWMGVVVMAAVTSLPELITGASSIVIFDVADIAAGDAIGSCMFNLLILAFLDLTHPKPLSARVHQGHVLAAAFGLVQLALASIAILLGASGLTIGWIGVQSVLFLAVYLFAVQAIFRFERSRLSDLAEELTGDIKYRRITLRSAVLAYAAAASVMIASAAYLPGVGEHLAVVTGIDQSFVGSLFVAFSTSLPELVVTGAAARMGALDMAVGNLFGSNLFNIAVLGVDDILYTRGSLLTDISPAHVFTLLASMLMTTIAIIGLTFRAQRKRYRLSLDAIGISTIYVLGVILLWRMA